ncbi:MAG: hypothetical protein U9R48_07210 [Chloroflexota bacterium]|nr:hypothetical protein [Chloroflexota bacterium]
MFSSPLFLFASTLATFWAAIFHLLLGQSLVDLILYWLIGLLGFAVGQALADVLHLHWFLVGQVHVVEGTLGCWLAMFVARWVKL